MKPKIFTIMCIILLLVFLVACNNRDPNGDLITTGRKPFAKPDPKNPYDEKLDHGYFDDLTNLSNKPNNCFGVTLTHTESMNNLFYDYVPEDFPEMLNYGLEQISDLSSLLEDMRSRVPKVDKTDYDLKTISNYGRTLVFEFNFQSHEKLAQAAKALYKHVAVKEIVPSGGSCGWFTEPDDPRYYTNQEYFANLINLEEVWDRTTGSSSVKIGVLDSGVLGTHADLVGNLNASLSGSFGSVTTTFADEANHGTSVAGIIGATGDNGTGNLHEEDGFEPFKR